MPEGITVGDRRTAITTYVLKIASRCNLACSYCYMYNGVDQSWRSLPRFISPDQLNKAFGDILIYARSRGLSSVALVFHGGEPSLLPLSRFEAYVAMAHAVLTTNGVQANLFLQTNGYNIGDDVIESWVRLGVHVGVSVDSSAQSHDRYRVSKRGVGSFSSVSATICRMRELTHNQMPSSALSVIDLSIGPEEAWAHFASLGISYIDILLPDLTWDLADAASLRGPYGGWLIAFWDLYLSRPRDFKIRWFSEVMKLELGGIWGSDSLGLASAGTLILDTDGKYFYHDALRIAEHKLNNTGISAGEQRLAEIESHEVMQAMTSKWEHLSGECRRCDLASTCGGGHIVHRYSSSNGLSNPSVYCLALKDFYTHVRSSLQHLMT